jgi:2-dehydropantoate 2-reductase
VLVQLVVLLEQSLLMPVPKVSMVARGAHLSAMKENGLTLLENGFKPKKIKIKVAQDPLELGEQDYVFVTLKAHSVPSVAESMAPLLRENTTVVSGVNGNTLVVFSQSWR